MKSSQSSQNVQVQYVYHCCLCLIFDQTVMAQEQKYLKYERSQFLSLSCFGFLFLAYRHNEDKQNDSHMTFILHTMKTRLFPNMIGILHLKSRQ